MQYGHGRLLKRIQLSDGGRLDIVARPDGTFRFYHRALHEGGTVLTDSFRSGVYISAETAEAAARLKFKL